MELPRFLKFNENRKRRLSIDFGASFIKVASVEASGDNYRLLAFVLAELNAGQKSVQELSLFLKQLLADNSITEKEVSLSISDPDWIFIKKLTLPSMPKDELLNAIKWQLKGEFSFDVEQSVSDLQIIREYADSEGAKKIELFCVFAKKEIIDKYVAVVAGCGLTPIRISSSVFNYCGSLDLLPQNPKISAILDVGHTHSQVSIYQNNKLSFARNLNFSTDKLARSLVGALVTDSGKIEINLDKATELLQNYGIPLDENQVLESSIKSSHIISLIRPLLETLAKELSRSFEYFKTESGLDIPAVLYITGGGANLKNLDRYLTKQLNLKVNKLPLPDRLEIKSADTDKLNLSVNQLSSAIGLGLSDFGINLLPRDIKNLKIESIQKTSLRVGGVVAAVIFLTSWYLTSFQISDYKKRLGIAKLHLQSVEEVKSLKQIVDSREDLINTIHTGKVPSGGLLKLISAVIPPSIILDEFSFDQAQHEMWLRGIVTNDGDSVEKVLTNFMTNLENSKFIHDATLVSSKEEQGVKNFEIKCELAK